MRFPSKREIATLAVAGTLSGCSMIYDLSPDQCGTTADCSSFGENYFCEEGTCKLDPDSGGKCETNAQCLDLDPNRPKICVELEPGKGSTRDCVDLTTPDCPRILPTGDGANGEQWRENLRLPGSIVIGAFGFLPPEGFSTYTRNYDLALTQLSDFAGGVKGTGGTLRPVVAVLCNNDYLEQAPLLENVKHLVDTVRVPAIISSIRSGDLLDAFSQTKLSDVNPDVLFVSPNSSTEGVADLEDDNLVWNILPNGEQVAIPYGPLLTRTIDYLHEDRGVPVGENIKVAVVFATDQRLLIDIKAALPDLLTFNGMDYETNRREGYLQEIEVTSSYQDPTAPLTGQIDAILEFAPHVIIEIGANELFSTIMQGPGGSGTGVEDRWDMEVPDQPRPFYLLSPYHYLVAADLPQVVGRYSTPDQINLRMAGVNYASAPEEYRYITNDWLGAYANFIPDDPGTSGDESDTTGYENYYDAPWYVFGALAATTGRQDEFTGLDLAQGMLRLQNPNGDEYAVGGNDIVDAIDALADGESINYIGTMGLPTFDSSGARTGSGSVWCVTNVTTSPPVQQLADVLRVDPGPDLESTADDVLVGDGFAPCNPNF
jgi:hypothetical protein